MAEVLWMSDQHRLVLLDDRMTIVLERKCKDAMGETNWQHQSDTVSFVACLSAYVRQNYAMCKQYMKMREATDDAILLLHEVKPEVISLMEVIKKVIDILNPVVQERTPQ